MSPLNSTQKHFDQTATADVGFFAWKCRTPKRELEGSLFASFRDNADTIRAISIVWKCRNAHFVSKGCLFN